MTAKHLYVVGLGFSGLEIAKLAKKQGWMVSGSVTSEEKAARMREEEGIDAEMLTPSSAILGTATHIVSTVAPEQLGDPVLPLVRHTWPKWFGYLSTTGVYGDRDGAWVDENDTPKPVQPRSRYRLEAEKAWQVMAVEAKAPLDIFRLPAIYGPGRSALDQVREGRAHRIDKPGQVFCRVHVADIATAVVTAMSRATGTIYNVTDDEPAPQSDVIAFACRLLGLPTPKIVPWQEASPKMSDMARSFYAENRRVRNDRLKRELGVKLQFPTYREGLSAIARGT